MKKKHIMHLLQPWDKSGKSILDNTPKRHYLSSISLSRELSFAQPKVYKVIQGFQGLPMIIFLLRVFFLLFLTL